MDTDQALKMLGPLGRFQVINYLVTASTSGIQSAWIMLGSVFFAMEPHHHCALPIGEELNESVPFMNKNGRIGFDNCKIYSNFSKMSNTTQACPSGWTFDNNSFTIVHQWNLVCNRAWMVEMSQTVLVAGVMVGALLMTILSDRFGRKKIFLANLLLSAIVGCATAGINNYFAFNVMRFLSGICMQGIVLPGFVLACELFPADKRTVAAIMIHVFWTVGVVTLAGVACLLRDWRYFIILTSLPGFLAVPLYWLLSESLPWLVAKGRLADAQKVLCRAARWNRVTLPEDLVTSSSVMFSRSKTDDQENVKDGFPINRVSLSHISKHNQRPIQTYIYTLCDIFRSRKLTIYAFIMVYIWCANVLIYFGLSLSIGSLAGNIYLNFFYSGLAEIAAFIISAIVLHYIGRRWPIFAFQTLAAITMFISTAVPRTTKVGQDVTTAMAMIGKFGITGSFAGLFLYAPELFPTTLRAIGIGMASFGGRIGNICAPFSAYLARTKPLVIGGLFGGMCSLAAIVTLLLPETLGHPLATTIEEVESWGYSHPKRQKGDTVLEDNELRTPLSDNKEQND